MSEKVHLHLDRERVWDTVSVDQFLALQAGDLKTIADVLAHFVMQDGAYMDYTPARALIGQMTVRQLLEAAKEFAGNAEESAVPFVSGPVSGPD